MKSCHDVVTVINEETLGSIWECYSIPEEYALRAPLSEQRPYNPESSEISISVDALEVGVMDLNALRRKPRMPNGKNTTATGAENSPSKVEEIRVETTTKRLVGSPTPNQATAS
ncbi:hypothetical protein GW17_00051714 [Ensete ventricosum]|nr:hypothetical protein GW17_00051714 [Ensete ventricosum]